MVAQKQAPLAVFRNLRRLLQDFRDRLAVFELQSHEHAGHERKMERHVELVAISEIRPQIGWPLVRLRQQHSARELSIHARS